MADSHIVDVPGLGKLPANFTRTFDGINISSKREPRRHNEGDYELTCRKNWFFRDRFAITGTDKQSHYRFDLDFNAWSSCLLWRKGRVSLFYHKPSRNWRIQTFKPDGTKWEVCNPDAVIDRIAGMQAKPGQTEVRGALECFNSGSDEKSPYLAEALNAVIAGLRAKKNQLAAQMPRYEGRVDCIELPENDTSIYITLD